MEQFDVIVIGTGPAGEGAAMMLAKHHRRVAVVERYVEVGGGCTHWGTIPSSGERRGYPTRSMEYRMVAVAEPPIPHAARIVLRTNRCTA